MIYLSKQAHPLLKQYLLKTQEITEIESTGLVSDEIGTHPDLYLCDLGLEIFFGDPTKLSPGYPGEVRYNAACTGRYFIHNLKYTDPQLLEAAKTLKMTPVHVNQGYSKCNLVVVDEESVITSDEGMGGVMRDVGMKVLTVEPGHVELPGFAYGFLGGTSGRVGEEIIFHGNLLAHPQGTNIISFIENRSLKVRYFSQFPLRDIGSIIASRATVEL